MERSIATLKVNTIKNETRTQNDIKKRTKENTQLLVELNSIKLEVKRLEAEITKKSRQHVELEHEIGQVKKQLNSQAKLEEDPLSSTTGGDK
jgi:septal ring factor EnvC (AmiA/AmiB activator)